MTTYTAPVEDAAFPLGRVFDFDTRMAELPGCEEVTTELAVMSWLGHESVTSAQLYAKTYDRARAADEALAKLGHAAPSKVVRLRERKGSER